MEKRVFKLSHDLARSNAINAVKLAPDNYLVTIGQDNRTLAQNRLMWGLLNDVSKQIDWEIREGFHTQITKLDSGSWKDLFTSALVREQREAKGIYGGVVALGASTRKMNKSQFGDLINLIYAFGNERGVIWSDLQGIELWT